MVFLKEHLVGKYLWHAEDDKSSFSGEATRRLFDPFNGDQVLFMINLYASRNNQFTLADGLKIEDQIKNRLPTEKQSEVTVLAYLAKLNSPMHHQQQDQYIHPTESEIHESRSNGTEKSE